MLSRLMKSSPTAWRLHELTIAVVYWEVNIVRCCIDLCKYISWSHLATKSLSTLQLGQYYNHSERQARFQMVISNNRINCATHPYRSLLWSTIDVVDWHTLNLQSFTELISTFKVLFKKKKNYCCFSWDFPFWKEYKITFSRF